VSGVVELAAQNPVDQSRHLFVAVRARTSGAQFIVQTSKPLVDETPAPLAHRRHAPAQTLGDDRAAFALRGPQHQPSTSHYRMRQRPRRCQRRQLRVLLSTQHRLRLGSPNRHRHPSLFAKDASYASNNYAR